MWNNETSTTISDLTWNDARYPDKVRGLDLGCSFADCDGPGERIVALSGRLDALPAGLEGAPLRALLFTGARPAAKAIAVQAHPQARGRFVARFDLDGWDLAADEVVDLRLVVAGLDGRTAGVSDGALRLTGA